jgi:ABC-type iron transport system FetAB ATPase subunit
MDNRQIDALVAQYVMGDGRGHVVIARSYSTDIAAAWQVLEKFDNFDIWKKTVLEDKLVDVSLWHKGKISVVRNLQSVPLAICLAALKSVGITPNDG